MTHAQREGSRSLSTDPLHASIASCNVLATRFIDWETMAHLGLRDDMELLFANMGLRHYMHLMEYTHDTETRHFLSSLRVKRDETDMSVSRIRFRIHGQRYHLRASDLRDIYGFDRFTLTDDDLGTTPGMADLWHRTASGVYQLGRVKASNIRNPAIKLAQRSLGFAFFGRHVVGPLTTEEWKMVCFALRPFISDLQPPVSPVPTTDPVVEFIGNLLRIQDVARAKKAAWPLCIGGALTPIFRHCGVELTDPIPEIPLIDMRHLLNSHFLTRCTSGASAYTYTWAGRVQELLLPRPDLVSLYISDNILFTHILDESEQDESDDGEDDAPVYGDARYMQPIQGIPRTPMEQQLVQQNSLLQRWNRWQSRTIGKMARSIKALKRHVRSIDRHTGHHCSPYYDEARTKGRHDHEATPESSNPSMDLDTPSDSGPDSESPTF